MKKVELSGSIHSGEFAPIGYSVKGSLITFNLTLPLLGAGKGGDTIVRVLKSFEFCSCSNYEKFKGFLCVK